MKISSAESVVMEALWREAPRSAEEITAEVAPPQGWTLATVKTLINRLLKKHALGATPEGRRYLYRPLVARNPRHRMLLRGWLVIYAFVGIQMGWVLRPFIGDPDSPTRFFRQGAWGNAYVELGRIISRVIGG